MNTPCDYGEWMILDETPSTQDVLKCLIEQGAQTNASVVFAHNQTSGRGRFGRIWYSDQSSLTFSIAFRAHANHPKPWLLGMAVACAAAGATHTHVAWPNDIVCPCGLKVGGILTELARSPAEDLIPVVGVGINIASLSLPVEVQNTATDLATIGRGDYQPMNLAKSILNQMTLFPEINAWEDLSAIWETFDLTPKKRYTLLDGSSVTGVGIGPDGCLLCSVDGEIRSVMAAEAHFGPAAL